MESLEEKVEILFGVLLGTSLKNLVLYAMNTHVRTLTLIVENRGRAFVAL
jgi:hypothetical protein